MKMMNNDIFYSFVIPVIERVKQRYPKAKKTAVENFLSTAIDYSMRINLANLDLDAKLYKWDSQTYKAIFHGLKLLNALGIIRE